MICFQLVYQFISAFYVLNVSLFIVLAILNNRLMANLDATTKNMSNNHDTSQPSFQSDVERKGTDVLLDRDGQVLEETRQVLKRFLVKHLSQNGKGATNYVEQKGIECFFAST